MSKTSLLTAALVVAMSGAAYAGPTTLVPRQTSTPVNGAYAQYVPKGHDDGTECRYQGGPKSPIWHQMRRP
jgi:hypothetical protein